MRPKKSQYVAREALCGASSAQHAALESLLRFWSALACFYRWGLSLRGLVVVVVVARHCNTAAADPA